MSNERYYKIKTSGTQARQLEEAPERVDFNFLFKKDGWKIRQYIKNKMVNFGRRLERIEWDRARNMRHWKPRDM